MNRKNLMHSKKTKNIFTEDFSILTIGTNSLTYVKFALNCAKSILIFNDIKIYIVSNINLPIPKKYKDRIFIIPAKPEHLLLGIGIKLYLDEYAQTKHSIFIDSDCICYDNIAEFFNEGKKYDVTVVGNIVPTENWCSKDLSQTIKQNWGLETIIRFNGAFYYFKKSALTTNIFTMARKIAENYDGYGFERIKNKWMNEECPLSISMMLNKQLPIPDNGYFITDLFTDRRPDKLNVLNGDRGLKNGLPGSLLYRPWYPATYSPIIIHFGGSNFNSYPYKSQSILIKLASIGIPSMFAYFLVNIFVDFPYKTYHKLRELIVTNN